MPTNDVSSFLVLIASYNVPSRFIAFRKLLFIISRAMYSSGPLCIVKGTDMKKCTHSVPDSA